MFQRLARWLRALRYKTKMECELDEEVRFHLEREVERNIAQGMSPEEARRTALLMFGGVEQIKEECRDVRGTRLIEDLWQDLRYGVRMLVKNPGFTFVAIITLALGIGANAALFSVVNGVLLNPLPYPQPDQLVTLHASKPNFETGSIPYLNFRDWQKENQTFSAMAISRGFSVSMTGIGEAERVSAQLISSDFFSVLAVEPMLGRTFAPNEDESGANPVALISASLWHSKFSSELDVLEKSITLNDRSYTIVGIIPASFKFFREVDVYLPIGQWNNPALRNRSAGLGIHGIGRLKPGITIEQAQSDLDRVSLALAAAYPDTNKGIGAKIVPLKERIVSNIRPILLILLGAVGFVLLIACMNVSNLLFARSTSRAREFAIRAALGAGQWRLLQQLLSESILLALVGGGLGLVVAGWGMQAALSLLPIALPRAEEVGLDARVLLFTFAISLLTGILAGLAPALKTSHWRLSETLKEGRREASTVQGRALGILIAVEMALALVLLIGAGLMIRSLNALWNIDPGFRPNNVLTFGLSLSPSMKTTSPEAIRGSLRELNGQINSIPGIQAVSFSWGATPLQNDDDIFFWLDGQPKPSSQNEMNVALLYTVEPDYLTTMGIPLKQGRFFTDQDNERSMPVVVIDEVFAHKYFASEDPIGKRLNIDGEEEQVQIVGVVGHVKQWGLDSDDKHGLRAQIYEPFRQLSDNTMARLVAGVDVVVRSEGASLTLFDSIRQVVQRHNSNNTIFRPQTMNEIIAGTLAARRFLMILLDVFALIALLLASVGLYGVISYLVGQRTHELGIRLALGAQRKDVLRLVLNHGMKMVLSGVIFGLITALCVNRLMVKVLYGVSTTDPMTFLVITFLLLIVALLACFIPAWRATQIDPVIALRHE
ncbi:MAG: ABC transporter permease [Acidobacteriota bacterium]